MSSGGRNSNTNHIKASPPAPLNTKKGASEWKLFKQMWENYVVVAKLENESQAYMKALFLHTLGGDGLAIVNGLELEQGHGVDDIVAELDNHFIGQINETYERFVFNTRDQKEGESFEEYINCLRQLIKTCNYPDNISNSLLRDRLVLGIRNKKCREELIQDSQLTLKTCIDKCRAAESSVEQLKSLGGTEAEAHAVHHKKKKEFKSKHKEYKEKSKKRVAKCKYCGQTHEMKKEKCPAYGEKCTYCQGENHFEKVCLRKKRAENAHMVGRYSKTDSDDEYLFAVGRKDSKIIKAEMIIDGKPVVCQIDSGASVNVISAKHVGNHKLSDTKTSLHVYNGAAIETLGKVKLDVHNPKTSQTWKVEFMVVKQDLTTLLGKTTSESMNLITIHYNHLSIAQVEDTANVELGYEDVFAPEQGSLPGIAHFQVDEAATPTVSASGRIPLAMKTRVKEELERLESQGILAKVEDPTSWCSRMVVATRKSGKLRICIDPRPLNKALKRERYPLPTLDDVIPKLSKSKVFSKLDLSNAYWHVHLDEESSILTTFQTPFGRYRWRRLPFGTSVSSELFQKRLDQALEGLDGVIGVTDDVIVHGEDMEQHDKNLKALLERCRKVGIRLNKEDLRKSEITFLGHKITKDGLKIDPEKLEAVKEMPKPQDVEGVRRLCGFVNYLAKFLPKLSEVLEPIRQLTREDVIWNWTPACDRAFETVQKLVTEAPVLAFYNPAEQLTIQCDASQSGLGAVLLQNDRPIAYSSRALNKTEQNYAQIEKELLAIVFSVEKWHQYTFGRPVKIQSDHKPLEAIFQKPLSSAPRRLQGMMLRIQGYDLHIVYKKGKEMTLADTLSRAYINRPSEQQDIETINSLDFILIRPERLEKLKEATAQDETLQILKAVIMNGWPEDKAKLPAEITPYFSFRDELSIQDGLIIRGDRVVIPWNMRAEIKKLLHSTHSGIDACLRRARECIFWPGMTSDISQIVRGCEICQKFQASNQPETLEPHELPERQWQKIGVDLFEQDGKDYLITVDYLSNFWEIDRLRETTATTIIRALKAHIARNGIPCTVFSDKGTQFMSSKFQQFALDYDFLHDTSDPHHHQANGKVEAAVKTAKAILRKNKDGDQFMALLNYRNTPSQNSNTSPAQKFFNRRTRTLLPSLPSLLKPKITLESDLKKMKTGQTKMKHYFDRKAKDLKPLGEGDAVVMKPMKLGQKEWKRGTVVRGEGRSYDVETQEGTVLQRNRVHLKKVPDHTPAPDPPTPTQTPAVEAQESQVQTQTPPVSSSSSSEIRTRSGRVVKSNQSDSFVY